MNVEDALRELRQAAGAFEQDLPEQQRQRPRRSILRPREWGTRIAVENSTQGATPPQHMPVPRWWWVWEATPGSRVSALASEREAGDDQPAVRLPDPDEDPSFAGHIKPLFRTKDRQAMRFAFDVWSDEDASQHGDATLARLTAGRMPCDGAWPRDRIEVFERWIAAGTPP